jgi:hypothetical protein
MRTTHSSRARLRRSGHLLAALVALIIPLGGVTVLTAGPASASISDTDPKTTGCWDSNAYALYSVADPYYGGTLQLWWSPDCQTNWGQDYSTSTDYTIISTTVEGGRTSSYFGFNYKGWAWSNQMYAPTANTATCIIRRNVQLNVWGPVVCVGQFDVAGAYNLVPH